MLINILKSHINIAPSFTVRIFYFYSVAAFMTKPTKSSIVFRCIERNWAKQKVVVHEYHSFAPTAPNNRISFKFKYIYKI